MTRAKEYAPRVVMATSQVPAWFGAVVGDEQLHETFPFLPNVFNFRTSLALIFGSILLLIIGVVAELRREKSIAKSEENLETALRVHAALDDLVDEWLSFLAEDLGLTEEGRSLLADRKAVRTTLYIHHAEKASFIPVCRQSTDPRFNEFGRKRYPDNEGLIAEAWQNDWHHVDTLEEDRALWDKEMETVFNIPLGTAKALAMHSRSMAAICLQSGREKVGIIVFESTLPYGIKPEVIDHCLESNSFSGLSALMPLLKQKVKLYSP